MVSRCARYVQEDVNVGTVVTTVVKVRTQRARWRAGGHSGREQGRALAELVQ